MDILHKICDTENYNVGGGAASALAGAKAAGMIGMVANLSLGKAWGLTDEEYAVIAQRAQQLASDLIAGANDDEAAFLKIRDALSMPKANEFDKLVRKQALQQGSIAAALVPKDNGYRCREVVELGLKLSGNSNSSAESDLRIALMLAEIGVRGCILNIEANLPLIKDNTIADGFREHIAHLESDQRSDEA